MSLSGRLYNKKTGKLTPKPVRAIENGAQTPTCGLVVVSLTTRTSVGTPGQKTPVICMHALVPITQYLLPRDFVMQSRKRTVFYGDYPRS